MGSFLSKTSKSTSNKTIAKLTTLQTDIEKLEKKKSEVKASQKVLLQRMIYLACSLTLTYGILAYTLLPTLLVAWLDVSYWLHFIILWSPVVIIPLFYIFAKKSAIKWYNWRLNRWERKLKIKKKSKLEILDNVMEVETYNNAMKIFEQFDKSRLNRVPKLKESKNQNFSSSSVRQRNVGNVHPLVQNSSSVKYHGFSRNEAKSTNGLDKDNIRNMAMNYTFSGRSSSNKAPENNSKMNTTFSSPLENTTKPAKLTSDSKGDTKKVKKVIGPATPSLDADALKALTKGLVGKKKKTKKVRSEKSEDNSKENNSIEEEPVKPLNNFTSPRTKELREAKSKIQELQEEIERLKAAEEEKKNMITVVGKLPNKALTRSSTNSSRADMILRAKKIEKQQAKSKLVIEKQLRKSATQESNLSGMIAELPDSDEENEENKLQLDSQIITTSQISQRPSQNSLMTDQSEQEEVFDNNKNNGTIVQEMTDDDEEEPISENDEGRGNSNEDNSLENIEKLNQNIQNNDISEDELLDSENDDEHTKVLPSKSPEINDAMTS